MPSTKLRSTTDTRVTKSPDVGALPFAPRTPARPFVDAETTTPISKVATIANVKALCKAPAKQSPSNVLGDPTQNLKSPTPATAALQQAAKTSWAKKAAAAQSTPAKSASAKKIPVKKTPTKKSAVKKVASKVAA